MMGDNVLGVERRDKEEQVVSPVVNSSEALCDAKNDQFLMTDTSPCIVMFNDVTTPEMLSTVVSSTETVSLSPNELQNMSHPDTLESCGLPVLGNSLPSGTVIISPVPHMMHTTALIGNGSLSGTTLVTEPVTGDVLPTGLNNVGTRGTSLLPLVYSTAVVPEKGAEVEQAMQQVVCIEKQVCRWRGCMQVCETLDSLVNHVNDNHVKLNDNEMYSCLWEDCPRKGNGFNARYKMLIHVRTHTNEKPHGCYLCGKHFSRLENLKIHKRTHTGEKPYVCPHFGCDKAYSNSSDRFKHAVTHRVERPYKCKMPGCSKRYTDPSSLRKHIRSCGHQHTGAESTEEVSPASSQSRVEMTSDSTSDPTFDPVSSTHDGQLCVTKMPYVVNRIPTLKLINGDFYIPGSALMAGSLFSTAPASTSIQFIQMDTNLK